MRIISGKYKGLKLKGFDITGTRPTMDRVKESLYAMIYPYIKDSVTLDLFAGSGSLALEAISNGSGKGYVVDINNKCINIIRQNFEKVEEEYEIINADYQKALEIFKNQGIKFDLVFLDPPYEENLITPVIENLISLDLLNKGAIIVCEYESENIICHLDLLKEKKYGAKKVKIFKF